MIIVSENPDEIVGDENGVVVAHHKPPNIIFLVAPQRLRHDSGDSEGGAVALAVGVGEIGGVAGDLHRREAVGVVDEVVEPYDASHMIGFEPELDVVLSLLPELGGGGDAEHHVREVGEGVSVIERSGD